MNLKICFLAPSGFGKTTATKLLSEEYNTKLVKIGAPLYELQRKFYEMLGIQLGDTQDGELLQFYGYKIRKENPNYLLSVFDESIKDIHQYYDVIINDDCRPYDFDYLRNLGFVFIKINGYRHSRQDHSEIDSKSSLEWQSEIPCDYEVNNFGSILEFKSNLLVLMEEIKNDKKMLYNTYRKKVQL